MTTRSALRTIRELPDFRSPSLATRTSKNTDSRKTGQKTDASGTNARRRLNLPRKIKNHKSLPENKSLLEIKKSGGRSPVEIRLGEISAFQPFIAAYEKTLASKSSEESITPSKPEEKSDKSDTPFRPMFSEPGLGGPLPQPFSGLGSSVIEPVSAMQPAVPGGGQVIQSATGAAELPSPP